MFSFGEFELNEARFELRRGGRLVRVEPRVLELLIYLARHSDRLVTKDELLREVWEGRIVSETVLTHSIAEARKVLGGGDPGTSYIRTIHGRGYRLVLPTGPVAIAPPTEPMTVAPTPPVPVPPVTDQPVPAVPAVPALPQLPPMPPPGSAPPVVGDVDAAPAQPPAGRKWFLALAALLALAIPGIQVWRSSGAPGKPAVPPPAAPLTMAIVPLSAPPGETELQLTALSLLDLLSQRLASLPGVVLRASDFAGEASLEATSLAEFGHRVGAQIVLSGAIERSPQSGRGRVELTLHDLRPGQEERRWVPWRYDLPMLEKPEDLKSFRRTSEAIAHRVVEELRLDLDPSAPAGSAPRDLKAYRLFLLSFGQQAEVSCMGAGAGHLLRDSLALDPGYGPAWQAYASAEYNRAWACGDAREHYETALEALSRADALESSRMAAMLRAIILAETNRVEEGYAGLRAAELRWPGDAALEFQHAQLLHYAGFMDEAERRFERSLAADPLFAAEGWVPRTPYYRADYERFLELLPAIESPIFRFYRASAELALGRKDEARRLLEPVFRMNPNDLFARLSQALQALLEGNVRESTVILDHLALQRAELGGCDGEVTYKIAQLYARAAQPDKALKQLELAVDQGFLCPACVRSEPLFSALHSQPGYERLLRTANLRHRAFGARFELAYAP